MLHNQPECERVKTYAIQNCGERKKSTETKWNEIYFQWILFPSPSLRFFRTQQNHHYLFYFFAVDHYDCYYSSVCAYVCSVHGVWSPCCAYIRSICEMAYGMYWSLDRQPAICWTSNGTECLLDVLNWSSSAHTVTDAMVTIASVAQKIKEFFISFLFVSHSHQLQFYSVCSAFDFGVGRRSCDEKGKHICCPVPVATI